MDPQYETLFLEIDKVTYTLSRKANQELHFECIVKKGDCTCVWFNSFSSKSSTTMIPDIWDAFVAHRDRICDPYVRIATSDINLLARPLRISVETKRKSYAIDLRLKSVVIGSDA